MGAQDIHSFGKRLISNLEKSNCLTHADTIYFISCFQALSFFQNIFDILISCFFRHLNRKLYAFTLCLSGIQAGFVLFIDFMKFFFGSFIIRAPEILFFFHFYTSLQFSWDSPQCFQYNPLPIRSQLLPFNFTSISVIVSFKTGCRLCGAISHIGPSTNSLFCISICGIHKSSSSMI